MYGPGCAGSFGGDFSSAVVLGVRESSRGLIHGSEIPVPVALLALTCCGGIGKNGEEARGWFEGVDS
jgi:hypothetical protein